MCVLVVEPAHFLIVLLCVISSCLIGKECIQETIWTMCVCARYGLHLHCNERERMRHCRKLIRRNVFILFFLEHNKERHYLHFTSVFMDSICTCQILAHSCNTSDLVEIRNRPMTLCEHNFK